MPFDYNPMRDQEVFTDGLLDYSVTIPGIPGVVDLKVKNDEQAKLACPSATMIVRDGYFNHGEEKSRQEYLADISQPWGNENNEKDWVVKPVFVVQS